MSQIPSAADFEASLGSPFEARNPFSFTNILRWDESDEFPATAVDLLMKLGFNTMIIPQSAGGPLKSYDEMLEIVKGIGRRDMTTLIAVGKNFLGSLPIFLFGAEAQREQAAQILKQKEFISLAITERGNGSDLLSSQVKAEKTNKGWKLTGEKWLVNNIADCRSAVVLARTREKGGPLGFSLFISTLMPRPRDVGFGQKILTHGVRGMRMNSVQFQGAEVASDALLGKESEGFQQTLKIFQVSRGMAAGLVLGGVDTALRLVTEFCLRRQLYGHPISDLEVVKERLAKSYVQYLVMEIVARFAARAITALPEELSIISAFAKAFVPQQAESVIEDLAVTFGARSYLRETWYGGIFQKLRRDIPLVSLFDGSSQVNLYVMANQLPQLLSKPTLLQERKQAFLSCWSDEALIGPLFPDRLHMTNRGELSLLGSLTELAKAPAPIQKHAKRCQKILNEFQKQASPALEFRSAERLSSLLAAICVLWNQWKGTPLGEKTFEAAMEITLCEFDEKSWSFICDGKVFEELKEKVESDQNLGLQKYSIGKWFEAKKENDFNI